MAIMARNPHPDKKLSNMARGTNNQPCAKPGREQVDESEDEEFEFSAVSSYMKKVKESLKGEQEDVIDQDPSLKNSFSTVSEYSFESSDSDYSQKFEEKEKRPHVPSRRKDSLVQRKFTPFSKGG